LYAETGAKVEDGVVCTENTLIYPVESRYADKISIHKKKRRNTHPD
jgi:hypothetical protein